MLCKNKKIIVKIFFNNLKWSENRLKKKWIDHRMSLFFKYALSSLKIQTNQDFLAFAIYDPESKDLVEQALSNYPPLPDNVQFGRYAEFHRLASKTLQDYDSDYVYIVRLPTDDMYHKTFIQQLHDYQPKDDTKLLICQNGYIYDSEQNRIAKYYHFSPQFYTMIYKVEDYLKRNWIKLNGHADAINYPHEILKKRNYINHVHSTNISSSFVTLSNRSLNYMGEVITCKDKIREILKDFMEIKDDSK